MNTLVDFQLQQLVVPGTDLGTQRTGFYIPSIWRKSQFRNSHVVKTNVMFTTHGWEWSIQPINIVIWGMVYGMCFIHMTCVFLAEKFQKTMCGPTRKLLSNFRKFQWWDSDPSAPPDPFHLNPQCFPGYGWLVVDLYPSEKSWTSSVGMMTFPYMKWKNNPNIPNHQPEKVWSFVPLWENL